MKNIDYKKAFEKLVDQIKTENNWAHDKKYEKEWGLDYCKGMRFAYDSIEELAIKLENGEFIEDEGNDEDYEYYDEEF